MPKPYKAKSLKSAEREVRNLRRQLIKVTALLEQYAKERKLMAMLASDDPEFFNPLVVYEAKKIRDEILSKMR